MPLLSLSNNTRFFEFNINDKAFQSFVEKWDCGWQKSERARNKPLFQATKLPAKSITLGGMYLAHFRGGSTQKDLEDLIKDQQPLFMISGTGKYMGEVVITGAQFNKTIFLEDGTPLKVDFTVDLEEYND